MAEPVRVDSAAGILPSLDRTACCGISESYHHTRLHPLGSTLFLRTPTITVTYWSHRTRYRTVVKSTTDYGHL
jgi:hypothetical protein